MFHLVALAVCLGTATGESPIDSGKWREYNHLRMPTHGTVYKGMLYGFLDDNWARKNPGVRSTPLDLQGVPLAKSDRKNWKPYPFHQGGTNCRHHVGYDALWFSNSTSFLNRWEFHRIEEIRKTMLGPTDSGKSELIISGIPLFRLREKFPEAETEAFDSVPISKDGCRTFLLSRKEKKFEIWDTKGAVFQKPGGFPGVAVTNLDTLDSLFTEDFYAFVRKDDYYFVTESGKLYHAPPPKEGEKSRTMKELWVDAKRPIVAVIEDADHDKVWLFAKDKNAGAKMDLFFEMNDNIRTTAFDPAKLRPVNVEGRAKMLLEYLPLLPKAEKK